MEDIRQETLSRDQNHMLLFLNIKRALKQNLYDKNESNKTTRTVGLNYIAAVREGEDLLKVKDLVENYGGLTVYQLETEFMKALYVTFPYPFQALFIAVNPEYNSLDPEKLSYGKDVRFTNELKRVVQEQQITSLDLDYDVMVNIMCCNDISIAKQHQLTMEELYSRKLFNTHQEFVKAYRSFKANPSQWVSYDDLEQYDHIVHFSQNYYAIIRVMAEVYQGEGNAEGFVVHDAGSSTSQLALILATLQEEELMGLKVKELIASDLNFFCIDDAQRILAQYDQALPIRFVQRDFLDETQELPEADVTILNDVLEHFPNDEMAFFVFARLWKSTRKLFIVHVPQEKELGTQWGHQILFNKAKLIQWANRLNGHRSLGDDYYFNEQTQYSDVGFLFLKKCADH